MGAEHLALAEDVAAGRHPRQSVRVDHAGRPEPGARRLAPAPHGLRQEDREVAHSESLYASAGPADDDAALRDDTLRLLFVCCRPELTRNARVALALKITCGFSTGEIARAFPDTGAAVGKRLVRTKQRIRKLGTTFEIPPAGKPPARLGAAAPAGAFATENLPALAGGLQSMISHDRAGSRRCGLSTYDRNFGGGTVDFHNNGGNLERNRGSATAYTTSAYSENGYVYAGVTGGYSVWDKHRTHLLGTDTGDTDGYDVSATVGAGHRIRLGARFDTTPYAASTYLWSTTGGFRESGTALAPDVKGRDYGSLRVRIDDDFGRIPRHDLEPLRRELHSEVPNLRLRVRASLGGFRFPRGVRVRGLFVLPPVDAPFRARLVGVRPAYSAAVSLSSSQTTSARKGLPFDSGSQPLATAYFAFFLMRSSKTPIDLGLAKP